MGRQSSVAFEVITMTELNELCRDIQMKLPDDIWMLDALERYRRGAIHTDDFASMDGRFYVFGVVEVPLAYEENGSFTWGCWIEVDKALHDAYLEAFRTEMADRLTGEGRLANDIPGYEDASNAIVKVAFSSERRPVLTVDSSNSLGQDQKNGLSLEDHQALDNILFGDDEEEADEEDWNERD